MSMAAGTVDQELQDDAQLQGWPSELGGYDALAVSGGEAGGSLAVGLTTIRQVEIPRAIEQLDDIVRGTEGAVNQIIDACTQIEALGDEFGGEVADRIGAAAMVIYEACSFQDLAGQRITNITKTLGLIEGKLSELASQFGLLADDPRDLAEPNGNDQGDPLENVQLSGPQHPERATDQASVDRLFAQIK
jgi:chemotaxis regulatin CheY-phosphate phosphatase CheZ